MWISGQLPNLVLTAIQWLPLSLFAHDPPAELDAIEKKYPLRKSWV